MTTLAFGHYVRFYDQGENIKHAFQNFFIGENKTADGITYSFVPFGFSGLTTSRQGDLQPASLVFPNTELSRGYLEEALRGRTLRPETAWRTPYVVEVDVNILNPDNGSVTSTLFTYVGQATNGGWDDTKLTLELSSVLDAASADIPTRTLHRRLVGSLPTTGTIRLR